jgi:HEPN domain-containing protein
MPAGRGRQERQLADEMRIVAVGGKPAKKGLDPLKIFIHASNFHKSYEMLLRSAVPEGTQQADENIVAIIGHPALMISAFASELYLKCLICVETDAVPNTHDLNVLFRALRVSTRHELDTLWDYDITLSRTSTLLISASGSLSKSSKNSRTNFRTSDRNVSESSISSTYSICLPLSTSVLIIEAISCV